MNTCPRDGVSNHGYIDGSKIDWIKESLTVPREAGDILGEDSISDFNQFRAASGLPPVKSRTGRKKVRSYSLSDEAADGLRFLAAQFEIRHGEDFSVSGLLEAIGTFQFALSPR